MKQLALDTQSFEKLRKRQCLYVDKTEDIYRMITGGKIYFLSRPRRFGKSLPVSTLEAIFKGKKDLFEGLSIYDKWDWEQPGLTVVAEVKYDAKKKIDTLPDEALKQIHERRYYNKYTGKVFLLGIAFSEKQPGCRMEELNM